MKVKPNNNIDSDVDLQTEESDSISDSELTDEESIDLEEEEYDQESDIETIEIHQKPVDIEGTWKLVPIYKRDVHGNKRIWNISFNGTNLQVKHGVLGGGIQIDTVDVVAKGGRTLGEQAFQEASRRYINYIREGYKPSGCVELPLVKAMKGNKLREGDQYMTSRIKSWPVAVDPKLDDIRFLVRLVNGVPEGRTWTNIVYHHMNHILEDVAPLLDYLPPGCILDGGLYIHGVDFQVICSMVKSDKNLHPQLQHLQYHIYDIAIERVPFEDRKNMLIDAFERYEENGGIAKHFCIVPSYLAYNLDDILDLHEQMVKMGVEGTVIKMLTNGAKEERLRQLSYYRFNKRCNNVLKLKDVEDDEFEIVDIVSATGRERGTAVFVLKTGDGKEFRASPMGDSELRKEYLDNKRHLKGKMATVVYQNLSDEGIPRFPKVKTVRDYE